MGKMRWKKDSPPTGLMAVGAGSLRTSYLHDGERRYACITPVGGNWRGPFEGWYFVAGWDSNIPYHNSYQDPLYPDEKSAKAAARKYVEDHLNAKN